MRNINEAQAVTIQQEMHNHLADSFDLAQDPADVPMYHILPHTQLAEATLKNWMIRMGVFTEEEVRVALVGESGHDAVQVDSTINLLPTSPKDFRRVRVRNMSGVAEDASFSLVSEACVRNGLCKEVIADISGIIAATTVEFIDGVLVQPRLLEAGNAWLNFFGAKADIAHIIPMTDEYEKEKIITRLWLEAFPDLTKAVLEETFLISEDDFPWIIKNLENLVVSTQLQFATSQYIKVFEDAEICKLPPKAMIELQKIFAPKVLKNHLADIDRIANRILVSPESVLQAIHRMASPIIESRKKSKQ